VGWTKKVVYQNSIDITEETTPIGCCLALLPAAWADQQHIVFEEHVKTHDNQEHK